MNDDPQLMHDQLLEQDFLQDIRSYFPNDYVAVRNRCQRMATDQQRKTAFRAARKAPGTVVAIAVNMLTCFVRLRAIIGTKAFEDATYDDFRRLLSRRYWPFAIPFNGELLQSNACWIETTQGARRVMQWLLVEAYAGIYHRGGRCPSEEEARRLAEQMIFQNGLPSFNRRSPRKPRDLSDDQWKDVLEALGDMAWNPLVRAVFTVLILCMLAGARAKSLLRTRIPDTDTEAGIRCVLRVPAVSKKKVTPTIRLDFRNEAVKLMSKMHDKIAAESANRRHYFLDPYEFELGRIVPLSYDTLSSHLTSLGKAAGLAFALGPRVVRRLVHAQLTEQGWSNEDIKDYFARSKLSDVNSAYIGTIAEPRIANIGHHWQDLPADESVTHCRECGSPRPAIAPSCAQPACPARKVTAAVALDPAYIQMELVGHLGLASLAARTR